MRRPLRGGPCAAVLCCLAAIAFGCGSDERTSLDSDDGEAWAKLGSGIEVEPDRPARAAERYVNHVSISAAPFALAQQVSGVTAAVGRPRMIRALEPATIFLVGARVQARVVGRQGRRTEVDVSVTGESLKPSRYRFVLVRGDGRWLVAYDTLTRKALAQTAPRSVVRRYLAAGRLAAGER